MVAAHGMLIAMAVTALVAERHPELLNEDGIYPIPVNASLTRGAPAVPGRANRPPARAAPGTRAEP